MLLPWLWLSAATIHRVGPAYRRFSAAGDGHKRGAYPGGYIFAHWRGIVRRQGKFSWLALLPYDAYVSLTRLHVADAGNLEAS